MQWAAGKVERGMEDVGSSIVSVLMGLLVYAILGCALLSPIVLSIRNLRGLLRPDIRYKKRIWLITVIFGTGLTAIYNWLVTGTTAFGRTDAYWTEQLIGPQLHQPLYLRLEQPLLSYSQLASRRSFETWQKVG